MYPPKNSLDSHLPSPLQQPRPSLQADLGAVQLQPHLAHGPRRRHPDPAAHGPPHHPRDGGTDRRGRPGDTQPRGGLAVLAELGLAGVVAADGRQGEVDAAARGPQPAAADGL